MKPITAVLVFFSLMIPSLVISYGNYVTAKEYIIEDVNQALAQTILQKASAEITPDTIKIFKSKLKIDRLKETSYLSMCTAEPSKVTFCSDTMSYKFGEERLHIRAYPNCSKAAVFGMSEQTTPGIMLIISLMWGMFSIIYFHKRNGIEIVPESDTDKIVVGNMKFSSIQSMFFNEKDEAIDFTPMQHAFMKLLITSEHKRMNIDEICGKLWPGKQNAKESLYTLVKRLKPVVENNSNIQIVSNKGGYYCLTIKNS